MRIGRTLPPAAAPIGWKAFFDGLLGILHGDKEIERFERELKEYFGKRHCFLVSSGKAALTLILLALKERYPDRTEVIIPAYTCYSVPSAIMRAGLEIKLCDLAENSFDFNSEQLRPMLESDRLLAVLPTHLFGIPADVERLKSLINDPQVTIIEDAAQAMGGEWQSKKLGTQGDVSFFSLGRGKAFTTVEGGIILTDDDFLAGVISSRVAQIDDYSFIGKLKLVFYAIALNILLRPSLFWIPKALPFLKLGETVFDSHFSIKRMCAFQAGLAKSWVDRLIHFGKLRRRNSELCSEFIEMSRTAFSDAVLEEYPDLIRMPIFLPGPDQRIRLLAESERQGLGAAIAYPDAISKIAECGEMFKGQSFPNAEELAQKLATLPVHPLVKRDDIMKFSGLVKSVLPQGEV